MALAIHVKSRDVQVTDGLREYAEKRLQKLSKFMPTLRDATVRECVERNQHRVEVTIEGDGVVLRGEERSNDMYTSVDLVLDKLEQRVKRYKDRHTHLRRHSHDDSVRKNTPHDTDIIFDDVLPAESILENEYPRLVREKRVTMKPMNRDDAAQMMDLIGHDFYMFLDSQTNEVHLIYRRKDGDLGLLAPKI